jgi:hypothetical protein
MLQIQSSWNTKVNCTNICCLSFRLFHVALLFLCSPRLDLETWDLRLDIYSQDSISHSLAYLGGTSDLLELYDERINNVTVRHLLNHYSGLQEYDNDAVRNVQNEERTTDLSPAWILNFTNRTFVCDPGGWCAMWRCAVLCSICMCAIAVGGVLFGCSAVLDSLFVRSRWVWVRMVVCDPGWQCFMDCVMYSTRLCAAT